MAVEAIAFSLIRDILYEAFSYFFEAVVAELVLLILRVSRKIDRRPLFEIEWRTLDRSAWPKGRLGALDLETYNVGCSAWFSFQSKTLETMGAHPQKKFRELYTLHGVAGRCQIRWDALYRFQERPGQSRREMQRNKLPDAY
jgi:hypothetical protein